MMSRLDSKASDIKHRFDRAQEGTDQKEARWKTCVGEAGFGMAPPSSVQQRHNVTVNKMRTINNPTQIYWSNLMLTIQELFDGYLTIFISSIHIGSKP